MEIRAVFKGFLFSAAVTLAVVLILAAGMYFGIVTDVIAGAGVRLGAAGTVVIGAATTAKKCDRRKLPNCMLFAALYAAALTLAAAAADGGAAVINIRFLILVLCVALCSFFGAVIGK